MLAGEPDASRITYAGRVTYVAHLADGHKYRLGAGPATIHGLRNIFAASSPSGLNTEVAKRAFENWIHRLRCGAYIAHGYRWWVLSNVCLTPRQLDAELLGTHLAEVAYNTTCLPLPPDSAALIYPGP